ncbi:MAG: isochorismatase family cysteine hydrolase [bacterium]|nr:isochorismatase family cysteine hydrolase [bacterium]MDZ4247698.1 isochorismatase family cysteine hydrolase [Patescibacteria group bacterium]
MAKTALIVVDVQNYFVNEHTAGIPGKVVDYIRSRKPETVFFTRFVNREGSNFVKSLGWRECMSSPDIDLHSELADFADESNTFDKTSFSIFHSKALADRLKEAKVTNIQLCGIDTDACVLVSAFEAFDRGYDVEVLEELTGSHHGKGLYDSAMEIIRKNLRRNRV